VQVIRIMTDQKAGSTGRWCPIAGRFACYVVSAVPGEIVHRRVRPTQTIAHILPDKFRIARETSQNFFVRYDPPGSFPEARGSAVGPAADCRSHGKAMGFGGGLSRQMP
jgi:hypothetical protein